MGLNFRGGANLILRANIELNFRGVQSKFGFIATQEIRNSVTMGDPLSTTASIIAVLQLTGSVISCIKTITDASSERQRLLDEIASIHYLLFLLKDKAEQAQRTSSLKWLEAPKGPLEQFKLTLESLASKLQPGEGLKKVGKAFIWPFQKGDVKEILSGLERLKSAFNLALQNEIDEKLNQLRLDQTGNRVPTSDISSILIVAWQVEKCAFENKRVGMSFHGFLLSISGQNRMIIFRDERRKPASGC